MNEELGFSYEILNDSYAAGSATLCIGALVFIPVALKFGRRPIYLLSLLLQLFVSIWAAKLATVADLILVNAFNCLLGALAEVIIQMTVADVFFIHQRGMMNSIYVWIMMIGCSLAPLAAGFITDSQGWRWVWWWMTILFGACLVVFFFLYEETKFVDILDGSSPTRTSSSELGSDSMPELAKDKKELKNKGTEAIMDPGLEETLEAQFNGVKTSKFAAYATEIIIDPSIPRKTYSQRLKMWSNFPGPLTSYLRHAYHPVIIIFTFPAALYVSVLYGLITAAWQVMVTVISSEMTEPPYNFNASQIGLMSVAPFIGNTIGSLISGPISDWLVLRLAKRNGGIFEPEMRLWNLLGFAPFVPAGMLVFGYGLGNRLPWIVIAVGYAIYGFGMAPVSSAALTYLIDAYTDVSLMNKP